MTKLIAIKLFVSIVASLTLYGFINKPNRIDPTGTYQLQNKIIKNKGDISSDTGKIQVKKIDPDKILMTFYIDKGAPSYNSGSFVDTLLYTDNTAIYHDKIVDPSCQIIFSFTKNGVTVVEEASDLKSACGFGFEVWANGFYKKTSKKVPKLKEPLTGNKVQN